LRGRPEPTLLKHLSDASFLGKLLAFPANVRLDWKVIASSNTLPYLASSIVMKKKCFITFPPDETSGRQNSVLARSEAFAGGLGSSSRPLCKRSLGLVP
jgi:hypothetical protein